MSRYQVTSDNGPTILTWAYSARNARFAYSLQYRFVGRITATKVED